MTQTIYGCPTCKKTFFLLGYNDENAPICPKCRDRVKMQVLDDEVSLDCGHCSMPTNAITFQMHGNLKRIPEGQLQCKYCENGLKW